MSAPAEGSARIDPTAIESSSNPRPPLSSDSPPRRSGIRETSEAKRKPLSTNARTTALRAASTGRREWRQRDQSVPGGRDSSQDWNPVRDSRLIASSTAPCGLAHSTTRWSG